MRSTVFEPVAREAYPMQGRGSDGRMYNVSTRSIVLSKADSGVSPFPFTISN